MRADRDKKFKHRLQHPIADKMPGSGSSFFSLMLNILAIGVFVGAYYYAIQLNLYPEYQVYMLWGMKLLVAYNIIVGAARSFIMPLLILGIGGGLLYLQIYKGIVYISPMDTYQIIGAGVVAFLINLVV